MTSLAFEKELELIQSDPFLGPLFKKPSERKPASASSAASSASSKVDDDQALEPPYLSIFYTEVNNMAWYSMSPQPFEVASSSDISIIFAPKLGSDYLCYSYIWLPLPDVWVRPEHQARYQIAWTPDIGYHVTPTASLTIDDVALESHEVHGVIAYTAFNTEPGYHKQHRDCVGNIKALTAWASYHERHILRPRQPWFYSRRSNSAFPLMRLSSQSKFRHSYRPERSISKLLRMRQLVDGVWKKMSTPDLSVLGGISSDGLLPAPTLWGMFTKISEYDMDIDRCEDPVLSMYIENIVVQKASNPVGYGSSVGIEIKNPAPVKAMWFFAHNQVAERFNERSNYSHNPDDATAGKTPLREITFSHSDTHKYENMDPHHFMGPLTHKHFLSPPSKYHRGMLGMAFSHSTYQPGIDAVILASKLRSMLSCQVQDPDADSMIPQHYRQLIQQDQTGDGYGNNIPAFYLYCVLLTLRRLNIPWRPSSGKQFSFDF